MRLFISEYLCSGAWRMELSGSLAREGRAMLSAILHDAARLEGVEILSTWDARLGPPPAGVGDIQLVNHPDQAQPCFEQCVSDCDAALIIAPEFENLLADRAQFVQSRKKKLIGADVAAIELCADKLKLAEHLQSFGVATIDTQLLESERFSDSTVPFPCVIKPRWGAGSQEMFLIYDHQQLEKILEHLPKCSLLRDGIIQPFLPGKPVSVAVIMDGDGHCRHVFPPADQILSAEGRFTYLGGRVQSATADDAWVQQIAEKACRSVPGLRGYVGVDLIVPHAAPHQPVVVEINPRLTTSYIGYRQLTGENLVQRLLLADRELGPIHWQSELISFTPTDNG